MSFNHFPGPRPSFSEDNRHLLSSSPTPEHYSSQPRQRNVSGTRSNNMYPPRPVAPSYTPGELVPHSSTPPPEMYQRVGGPSSPRPIPMESAPSYQSYDSHPGRQQYSNPYTPSSQKDEYDYFDSYHGQQEDDQKSYTSHTHLNDGGGGSEYGVGVGQVVNSMSYTGQAAQYAYPPPTQFTPQPARPFTPEQRSGSAHWHQVRNNLLARRVVKHIPLSNGNLVMDVPVPKGVIPTNPGSVGAEPGEMQKLRYSAATCDPDDFMRKKFNLRQYLYGRKTELFVRKQTATLTPDRNDNVQRGLCPSPPNTQLGHQEHCASLCTQQVQDLGSWRLEEGRSVSRRRRSQSRQSARAQGPPTHGGLCRGYRQRPRCWEGGPGAYLRVH